MKTSIVIGLLVLLSRPAAAQGPSCKTKVPISKEYFRENEHHTVELTPTQIETFILAAREFDALCTVRSGADSVQRSRLAELRRLLESALVQKYRNHPPGLAVETISTADPVAYDELNTAICKSTFVNIEPFVVTTVGGGPEVPDEGYVLLQRVVGGEAFVWRELSDGGAAIEYPGKEYTVIVVAFHKGVAYRKRMTVNSAGLLELPGRPGCKVVKPQLDAVRSR